MSKIEEVIEGIDISIEGSLSVEPLIGVSLIPTRLEKRNFPSRLSEESNSIRQKNIVSTSGTSGEGQPNTMDHLEGCEIPPPIASFSPIDPLVRPRGLPIIVPQELVSVYILSNLPKFYETKDEDLSRHMERFVEKVISPLISNQQYWLVWFPTTLDGEAYEWYRDHDEGHFQTWDQLQRQFLNEIRPEVGQSMAFRALMTMRQRRDEDISAYIRRFDLMCARYVGTLLNDDTLMQFFMRGFVKVNTIRGVLERNPRFLAEAKVAARDIEHIERDNELL